MEQERAAEGVRLTLKEGSVTNYVLTLQAADDKAVPVSLNAAVFKDATNKVRGIFASARDITDQKQLESQLQASQFYTRSLIESNIDALMTTDPLGIITDVNQQMEALTGRTREELIGSPFKNYFTDPDRAEDGIRLVLREGNVTNYELTARSKEGRETVVSYNATTFADRDGKLQGVFAAARDVTERKRFEQTLQEKSLEMENANLAKDRFLANMSHELRTPLNSIIGFAGTLLMKVSGPLAPKQEKQLQNISTSAKHLLLLINDLLDLAKIESGKIEMKLEPISCRSIIQEVTTIVSHLNLGKEENFDPSPAYALSDVNYHAGNKALDSLATEAANEYYTLSRELLPYDCWEEAHYERTFRIYQKAAKTELMCGNYDNSERLLTQLLDHAKTDLDKAECLAEQTTSLSSIGNFIKAIETGQSWSRLFRQGHPGRSGGGRPPQTRTDAGNLRQGH